MYTPNDPSDEKFFWVPYKYVYILLLVHVYAFYMVSYTFWSMYLHFRTHFALFYFSTMCELCPEQPFSWYDCLSGGKIWESSLVAPGKPMASPCSGQWLTKYSVFTFWHTSLAIIHGLQSLKVHIFSLLSAFSLQISQNGSKWPPESPHPPRQIGQFWANGSKFLNSVKRGWKYTKFATKIT